MALIWWWSSRNTLPQLDSSWLEELLYKAGHVGSYAVLAVLLERALDWPRGGKLAAVLLAVLYGIGDEYHQSWTPGRTPALDDVVADLAGAAIGTRLWREVPRYWRKSSKLG